MIFNDDEETFIFIDKKNKIISFSKRGELFLEIETTEISCNLRYKNKETRDKDYKKLKDFVKEEEVK